MLVPLRDSNDVPMRDETGNLLMVERVAPDDEKELSTTSVTQALIGIIQADQKDEAEMPAADVVPPAKVPVSDGKRTRKHKHKE